MSQAQHTFERPHRPMGIAAYNAVTRLAYRLGIRRPRFDEQELLDAARRRARLTDFGDESFREPLRVLLRAYDNEADLTPFGRRVVRWNLLVLLCNRLRLQHATTRRPEILDEPIRRPLFVLGLPRTGTTLLYNLLAQDPAARPLLMWEALSPAPRLGEESQAPDPRIRRARLAMRLVRWLAPNLATVHPVSADGPEECSRLMLNTFVTTYAVMEAFVPSYQRWFFDLPETRLEAAYRDYYRQLQVLQAQRPCASHWVLKSPVHLFALGSLLEVFPDAAVVQLHRDPRKVIPSLCSLFAVYQGMTSDRDRQRELGPEVLRLCVEGLRRGLAARDSADPGRVLDLSYTELMAAPFDALKRIYAHFGYEYTPAFDRRARQWHELNPQHKHGTHRYTLEQFGLSREMIDETFDDYCRHYGIGSESSAARSEAGGSLEFTL